MEGSGHDLLKELQIVKFAMIEANLFLDTHPDDQEAIEFFKKCEERFKELKAEWKKRYGKVQNNENGQMRWAWVDNPWPWEKGV